jgi:zinc and cadmium transporter
MAFLWTLGFVGLVSLGGVGLSALVLAVPATLRRRLVPALLSYATGTLLAAALVGLLPVALAAADPRAVLTTTLGGLLAFFVLERLAVWRHCHAGETCDAHAPAGFLILVGDALHNFVDGVVIAAAFAADIPLGIATGLAVAAHELPQEVGDFAILLSAGYSRRRALFWNLLSGATTLGGAVLAYVTLEPLTGAVPYVLALAAASFLYIGLADLVPGLHDRLGARAGIRDLFLMGAGVATIVLVA